MQFRALLYYVQGIPTLLFASLKKVTLLKIKIEKTMVKDSAAKIVSLAALSSSETLYSLFPKSISTSSICVFGERRVNDHHTITERNA